MNEWKKKQNEMNKNLIYCIEIVGRYHFVTSYTVEDEILKKRTNEL